MRGESDTIFVQSICLLNSPFDVLTEPKRSQGLGNFFC